MELNLTVESREATPSSGQLVNIKKEILHNSLHRFIDRAEFQIHNQNLQYSSAIV